MKAFFSSPVWQWRLALAWWLILFVAIMAAVLHQYGSHSTMPTYRYAATSWWQGHDPYIPPPNADPFLYFPQAAVLFTPFNILPMVLGDIAWRLFTFGLFFYALLRLATFFLGREGHLSPKTFLQLSLLAVVPSLAALRNAQFDLPLAATVVLATADIADRRWTTAAFWLCLGVALKPLGVVPLLLFTALFWPLIPRVAVGFVIILLLPFLHWSPTFVAHEYVRCVETLVWASKGEAPKFSELSSLLSLRLGLEFPQETKTIVRILFAAIYLGLGWVGVRRLGPASGAWLVGALSTDYLMLFNPRTETCSYVFLSPFVASLAVYYFQRGRSLLGWIIAIGAICLASDAFPKIGHFSFHLLTDRWLKPFIALLFLPLLIRFIFEKRSGPSEQP